MLDIRYTKITDISYLRKWILTPKVLLHFAMSTPEEVESALTCWMSFSRLGASLTATLDGVPCGMATLFLMPYKKVKHHCLFKICVDPSFWRQGVGTDLVRNIKHLAQTTFFLEMIHTEVFGDNPLASLLVKQGFKEFARQEDFVKNGTIYQRRTLFGVEL